MLQAAKPMIIFWPWVKTHRPRICRNISQKFRIDLIWQGKGSMKGVDKKTGKIIIEIDPKYFRPSEVDILWAIQPKPKPNSAGRQKFLSKNW